MENIDTRKEVYLLDYDEYQKAILYNVETKKISHIQWEDTISDKMLGYFHKVGKKYFLLFAANGRVFLSAEGWIFELNDPSTHLSIATSKNVTYFHAKNKVKFFKFEYPSWRSELGYEKPDIVSDIVEEDDELYDFFYYVYGMWLKRDFIWKCELWMETSDKAY